MNEHEPSEDYKKPTNLKTGNVYEWYSNFDNYHLYDDLTKCLSITDCALHLNDKVLMVKVSELGWYVLGPKGLGWIKNGGVQHQFKFFC